jgi:hypothetical protein
VSTQIIDHGWNRIQEEVKKAGNSFVKVGFPMDGTSKGENDMQTIIRVAAYQEFGTKQIVTAKQAGFLAWKSDGSFAPQIGSTITNPARPFISKTIDENKEAVDKLKENSWDAILEGKTTIEKALKTIGEWLINKTKKTIQEMKAPALHPFTIKMKRNSAKLLINTAQMINSIQTKVTVK